MKLRNFDNFPHKFFMAYLMEMEKGNGERIFDYINYSQDTIQIHLNLQSDLIRLLTEMSDYLDVSRTFLINRILNSVLESSLVCFNAKAKKLVDDLKVTDFEAKKIIEGNLDKFAISQKSQNIIYDSSILQVIGNHLIKQKFSHLDGFVGPDAYTISGRTVACYYIRGQEPTYKEHFWVSGYYLEPMSPIDYGRLLEEQEKMSTPSYTTMEYAYED